jgi:8-oxo-dGTP diphosphatase
MMNLMSKASFVCGDGVYVKNGKILLLRRNVKPFKNCWHLVGGHVDDGETLEEALIREFKEETNLSVEIGEAIDGRIEETIDRTKIIITFRVLQAQGKIKLNFENKEYGWFDKTPTPSILNYDKYIRSGQQKTNNLKNQTSNIISETWNTFHKR